MANRTCAVTGSYGYSGRALTARYLATGYRVCTLTNHPRTPGAPQVLAGLDDPFGGCVAVNPMAFHDLAALTQALRSVRVPLNTYGVRFNRRRFTFAHAVANSRRLFAAARPAWSGSCT